MESRPCRMSSVTLNTAVMTSRRSEPVVSPCQVSERQHCFTMHELLLRHRQTNFLTTHLLETNHSAGAGAHGTRVRVETSFPAIQFRHDGEIRTKPLVSSGEETKKKNHDLDI